MRKTKKQFVQELTQYVTGWVDACLKYGVSQGVTWQWFEYKYGTSNRAMIIQFKDQPREEIIDSLINSVISGGHDDSEVERIPTETVGVYHLRRIKRKNYAKYKLPDKYRIWVPQSQVGVEEDHERKPAAE